MKRNIFCFGFCAAYLMATVASIGFALPPYAQLYKAKYGYRPNCSLCHDLDSWEPNAYGKLFSKNGRNTEALSKIETLDPDEDKYSTLEEARAQSNPGDPRSTPKNIGDWLKIMTPLQPPKKRLAVLFPNASDYVLNEKTLSDADRKKIESAMKISLRDEDLYPTYFSASSSGELLGHALYSSALGKEHCFFLIGYAPLGKGDLKVAGISILHCHEKLFSKPTYLSQFKANSVNELKTIKAPKLALEAESKNIVEAVIRGAAVLEKVLAQ